MKTSVGRLLVGLLLGGAIAGGMSCGLRNLGEGCPVGPGGDVICAPGVCVPDPRAPEGDPIDDNFDGVCAECYTDADCLKSDPFDRPKCVRGLPPSEGGDGLPFCRHITDHPACGFPGGEALCMPGKCHPDAGVCVECTQDNECPSDRPVCDPGVAPEFLPFCRSQTE